MALQNADLDVATAQHANDVATCVSSVRDRSWFVELAGSETPSAALARENHAASRLLGVGHECHAP